MEILKSEQFVNEKLNIKPITTNDKRLQEPAVSGDIAEFIKNKHLKWNPFSKSYDCSGDVKIDSSVVNDGKFAIRFGYVKGNFDCSGIELESLEGAPQKVGGSFLCSNNALISLNDAPQEVGNSFICDDNILTSLKGAPQKVNGSFSCSNNKIESLEGVPQEISGDFYCSDNIRLVSLDGAPKRVGGNLYWVYNPNVALPKEKPSWLIGKIM